MASLRAWALAAVVLAVVLAAGYCAAAARYRAALEGLWVGDPGFLEAAGLDDLQVYIAPRGAGGRAGYLLAAAGGEVVASEAFDLSEGFPAPGGALAALGVARRDAVVFPRAAFRGGAFAPRPAGAFALPAAGRLTLSVLDGTLAFDDGRRLYALLGRDAAASAAAADAWRIGDPPS